MRTDLATTQPLTRTSDRVACRFFGHFCQTSGAGSQINRPARVEALMHSQAVRSLCHDGTTTAFVGLTARPPSRNDPHEQAAQVPRLCVAVAALSTLAGCELYFGDTTAVTTGTTVAATASTSARRQLHVGQQRPARRQRFGLRARRLAAPATSAPRTPIARPAATARSGTCEEGGFCAHRLRTAAPATTATPHRSSCEPNPPRRLRRATARRARLAPTVRAPRPALHDRRGRGRQGFGYCDETRTPASRARTRPAAATTPSPAPPRRRPAPTARSRSILDGCYTGECHAIASCDDAAELR